MVAASTYRHREISSRFIRYTRFVDRRLKTAGDRVRWICAKHDVIEYYFFSLCVLKSGAQKQTNGVIVWSCRVRHAVARKIRRRI